MNREIPLDGWVVVQFRNGQEIGGRIALQLIADVPFLRLDTPLGDCNQTRFLAPTALQMITLTTEKEARSTMAKGANPQVPVEFQQARCHPISVAPVQDWELAEELGRSPWSG